MAEDGRVALVTGASSGIGKAAALALLADGWRVVLSARRKDRLDEAIAQARVPAGKALAIAADVTDPASIHALFSETRAKLGRLDLLFNNAGVNGPPGLLEDMTKHAIAGLRKSTSLDGRRYDIACGQIDIGNARTELAERQPRGPHAEPLMDVEIVGRAVVHIANLPLDANVQFMTIMATKMPFIGRG